MFAIFQYIFFVILGAISVGALFVNYVVREKVDKADFESERERVAAFIWLVLTAVVTSFVIAAMGRIYNSYSDGTMTDFLALLAGGIGALVYGIKKVKRWNKNRKRGE